MTLRVKICNGCGTEKLLSEYFKDYRYSSCGYRAKCKACMQSFNKAWTQTEKGAESQYKSTVKYINSMHGKQKRKEYYTSEEGKKAYKSADTTYRKSPQGKVAILARNAKRRADRLNATPRWLSKDQLKLIEMEYQLASYLTQVTGIEHQVNHIYPLNNKNVCGLHVPWNLRVITKKENRDKGNKLP